MVFCFSSANCPKASEETVTLPHKKTPEFQGFIFLVAGTGLEPVTFGL